METIDQRVLLVLEKELKELSQSQRELNEAVRQISAMDGQGDTAFRIMPKDTIGKNVIYNVRPS